MFVGLFKLAAIAWKPGFIKKSGIFFRVSECNVAVLDNTGTSIRFYFPVTTIAWGVLRRVDGTKGGELAPASPWLEWREGKREGRRGGRDDVEVWVCLNWTCLEWRSCVEKQLMCTCIRRLAGEFEQTLGDREGQRSLAHRGPRGRKDSDTTRTTRLTVPCSAGKMAVLCLLVTIRLIKNDVCCEDGREVLEAICEC